jgi:two-component system nitrogen regulation sensor histidine kinase GlnL
MITNKDSTNLLDQLRQAVLLIDARGKLVYCNEAASLLWDRDSSRLKGLGADSLFEQDPQILIRLQQVLEDEKEYQLSSYELQTPPLQNRTAEIVLTPLRKSGGNPDHALITLLESTRFNHARKRERETELARDVGRLMSTLAHEIQNPLGGIKGMLQLMERELNQSEMDTEPAKMMFSEIERIERLLKQLLMHSHPMPIHPNTFNLHELLDMILSFERSSYPDLRFIAYYDASLPEIEADRDKLHQVFLNLLRNASEACPPDGRVRVLTRHCAHWELAGTNLDPGRRYILVSIEDEGPGIPEELRKNIFKPLFSTKKQGTGLGLSISFRLVESHGGQLRYHPNDTQGACFQVILPESQTASNHISKSELG